MEVKINLKIVEFLVVTFNLLKVTYRPRKKPNDHLSNIYTSSNHPTQIIKTLLGSISDRLLKN